MHQSARLFSSIMNVPANFKMNKMNNVNLISLKLLDDEEESNCLK
jgi:hypothetical protein